MPSVHGYAKISILIVLHATRSEHCCFLHLPAIGGFVTIRDYEYFEGRLLVTAAVSSAYSTRPLDGGDKVSADCHSS